MNSVSKEMLEYAASQCYQMDWWPQAIAMQR